MNNIITLKRLIDLISKQAGCDYSTAAAFVKAFTAQVRDALIAGETVRIKGIGDFSASDDHKITLEVDPSLAAIINEPFAMFSPEELDADIEIPSSSDALPQPKSEPEADAEPETENQEAQEIEEPANDIPVNSNIIIMQTEVAEQEPETETEPASPEVVPAQRPRIPKAQYKPWEDEESEDTSDEEDEHHRHHHHHHHHESEDSKFPYFWTLIGIAIGFIIGICIGFFVHDPIEEMLEPSLSESGEILLETDEPFASDSLISNPDSLATDTAATQVTAPKTEEKIEVKAETPTPANSSEKYETVASGVTLAKLAKKHYGSDIYWVFIFLENKDQIKNPDNLLLGAKLRIPPLSKYAPQSTEAERRAAAQKKMAEIRRK